MGKVDRSLEAKIWRGIGRTLLERRETYRPRRTHCCRNRINERKQKLQLGGNSMHQDQLSHVWRLLLTSE